MEPNLAFVKFTKYNQLIFMIHLFYIVLLLKSFDFVSWNYMFHETKLKYIFSYIFKQ